MRVATHYAEMTLFYIYNKNIFKTKRWLKANPPTILVNACETQAQNLATREQCRMIYIK